MSLSTGTRNLKFMQRAAARNSLNAAASPASSSTPSRPSPLNAGASTPAKGDATPVKGSNAFGALDGVQGDGSSTPGAPAAVSTVTADGEVVMLTKEEKDAMWVLPQRPSKPAARGTVASDTYTGRRQAQAGPSTGRRFVFERSYMPFMLDTDAETSAPNAKDEDDDALMADEAGMTKSLHPSTRSAHASTSTSAGGGRMAFGDFGQAARDAETPAGDAYGSDEDDTGENKRRKSGRAGYMQTPKHGHGQGQGQGARGKKRGSDTRAEAERNPYERDREEMRQAKIRKMAQDRVKREPAQTGPAGGFMRPSNYDPTLSHPAPPGPSTSEAKSKQSTADKLRNIASSRPIGGTSTSTRKPDNSAASNASSLTHPTSSAQSKGEKKSKKRRSLNPSEEPAQAGQGEEAVKRVKTEAKPSQSKHTSAVTSAASTPPAVAAATGPATGSASVSTGMSIDERERQIKAQKKKDKKARQKARESGEGVA